MQQTAKNTVVAAVEDCKPGRRNILWHTDSQSVMESHGKFMVFSVSATVGS